MHPGALETTAPCLRLTSRIRGTKHSVAKQIAGELLQSVIEIIEIGKATSRQDQLTEVRPVPLMQTREPGARYRCRQLFTSDKAGAGKHLGRRVVNYLLTLTYSDLV
jgi:hypothetical protein